MTSSTAPVAVTTPLDRALARLHTRGEEWPIGLTSHGPMVAEALDHVGRIDVIEPWAEAYATHLDERAPVGDPIDPRRWRDRLGHGPSLGSWIAHFEGELRDDEWPEVVRRWVPRLTPGAVTAATHGLIRTAHAVRGLRWPSDPAPSPERIAELARALGYWSARYEALPIVEPTGTTPVVDAVAAVPIVAPDRRSGWFISERVGQVDTATLVARLQDAALPEDPGEAVTAVADVGARLLLTNPGEPIAMIHALTAPESVRSLVRVLPGDDVRALAAATLASTAALWAAYGTVPPSAAVVPTVTATFDDLLDVAVASGDEHHIKVTVACLDAADAGGDGPRFRAAAASVLPG